MTDTIHLSTRTWFRQARGRISIQGIRAFGCGIRYFRVAVDPMGIVLKEGVP